MIVLRILSKNVCIFTTTPYYGVEFHGEYDSDIITWPYLSNDFEGVISVSTRGAPRGCLRMGVIIKYEVSKNLKSSNS